jgi:hypothetical protein
MDAGGRLGAALVMPVAAGGARLWILAGREPLLGQVAESQVVGRAGAAHPRGHPARVDRVAEHVRPDPGDGSGERRDEELAVRVGPRRPLAAPVHAGQVRSSAAVHAAAEVDQALRAIEKRGEQIRRDHVDRQDARPAHDTGVVDHRVHPAEVVHLRGELAGLLDVGQVPDDGRRAPVEQGTHGREPVVVADVDDDLVALLEQRLRCRAAETVRGAGDEDASRTHADPFAARGARRSVVVRVSPLVIGPTCGRVGR